MLFSRIKELWNALIHDIKRVKIQFSGNSTFALLPVVIRLKKSIVMIEDSRKNNSQVHVNAST